MNASDFPEDDYDYCLELLGNLGLPYLGCASEWRDELESGDWDALFSLLLCLIPAVQSITVLEYSNAHLSMNSYLEQVLTVARAIDGSVSLLKLKHVSLSCNGDCLELGDIAPFLALNSVETFYVEGFYMDQDLSHDFFLHLGQKFRTKEFHVESGCVSGDDMAKFLKLFPSLRVLHFQHCGFTDDDESLHLFPQKLIEAIDHLKSCLEVLVASTYNRSMDPVMGSLHEFEVLKDVSLERSLMLGYVEEEFNVPGSNWEEKEVSNHSAIVELLPRSLETLKITGSWQEYDILQYIAGLL